MSTPPSSQPPPPETPEPWRPWVPRFVGAGFRRTVAGGAVEEFEVDVVAVRHAPLRSHPRAAVLRTPVLIPDEDGLASDAEMEVLDHAVSRVCLALRAELRGVPVADAVAGGERRVLVYLPEDVDAARVDAVARGAEAERPFAVSVDDDPAWQAYFVELDDPDFAEELAVDLAALDELRAESGEAGALTLTFHGLFPSGEAAADAADIFADLGTFALDDADDLDDLDDEPADAADADADADAEPDEGVPMSFTAEVSADADEACATLFLARLVVGVVGGELDGWGATVG